MEKMGCLYVWERKRKSTYMVYLIQSVFIGLELTIIQGTLLDYLKTSVDSKSVKFWYDAINAVVYLIPILLGSLIGRWTDSSRNVRYCLIILNGFVLLGTILYMIPISPIFIFCGRLLHGFHFIIRSIMYSELSRIYSKDEVQEKIPAFLTGLSIGYCVGPLCNMAFLKVDLWVGDIHLTYSNASSIPLVFLSVMQITLLLCCSHNVSKEYDLKSHEGNNNDVILNKSFFTQMKGMACKEFLLLMAMSLHSGFGITVYPRIVPLVIGGLNYSDDIVNYCFLGFGVSGTIIALSITKMRLTSTEVFISGYASLISFVFTMTAIELTSNEISVTFNALVLAISVLSWSFFNATSKTFLIVTCNKLVSSSNQSFGESMRANVTMFGRLVTAFTVTRVYDNLKWCTVANFVLVLFFLVAMRLKKKALSSPKVCF